MPMPSSADLTVVDEYAGEMPMSANEEGPSRIPKFNSVREEAEFWDKHSTTEFEDEWEEVELEVSPDLKHILQITLDRNEFHRLSAQAHAQGSTMTSLARSWVLERLDQIEREADSRTEHRASAD
jgi:hypothetical protein